MICANSDCKKDFKPKTHNQKYCCDECCRLATNRRIMEKYYEKKAIRNGAVRKCKCGAKLSRYNEGNKCTKCQQKNKTKDREHIKRLLNDIS